MVNTKAAELIGSFFRIGNYSVTFYMIKASLQICAASGIGYIIILSARAGKCASGTHFIFV